VYGLKNSLHFGARIFDPRVGRWASVDALADHPLQIGVSPYAGMWNNPIYYNDPDGNCPVCPLIVKGLIEGGIELVTQLVIQTALNDGDVVEATRRIDWADVGIATTAGMAPTPGSGKAAVAARLAIEGGKALIDVSAEKGVQTSALVGGEKSVTETVIDASVGMVSSTASANLVDGSRRVTTEALTPSNYAPLTRAGKQAARADHAMVSSEGFERVVGSSGGVIGASSGEALKQVTSGDSSSTGGTAPLAPMPNPVTQPNDATRTVILIDPNL
jgi:RHS repeat-associated protein